MSKITKSNQALLSTTSITKTARQMMLALAGVVAATAPAFAIDDNALPSGGTVTAGDAHLVYSNGNTLDVNQGTPRVLIDWNSFNIGQNAATNFNQPGANAIAVNRVHDINPSQILGSLRANGQVVVLNTNGVFFGQNAKVDVAGLLVSTGDIDQDALMNNGQIKLSGINANNGTITNNGKITVHQNGLAAFVAPNLVNNGVIEAKLGKIALASGADKATVDFYGDGLVELQLDDKASKAMITNNGTLKADGGTIAVTVKAAKDVVNSVINMDGVVEANTFNEKNGVITLGAENADIHVSGKVNAKGGNGKVVVRSNKNIRVTETADINADAGTVGNGGTVDLIADDSMVFLGNISARGGNQSGNGGNAEVSGHKTLGFDGLVNLGASNGQAGTLLLDPSFVVIHSGGVPFGLVQNYVVSADKIALSLLFNNVKIEADNFIDVGTSTTAYINQSWTGNAFNDALITAALNTLLGNGNIDVSKSFGVTTAGSLTLKSGTVNFNRDLKMGKGDLIVNAGKDINVKANINMSGNGDIKATAGTGNILVNAALNAGTGDINLTAGNNITGNGVITADTFNLVTSNGNAALTGANKVNTLKATTGGSINFNNAQALKVSGIDTTNDDINLTVNGNVDVTGGIDATGGNVKIAQTGILTAIADSVKTTATGTINLIQNAGGSIQTAINAIKNAGTGESKVSVNDGLYTENVLINKSLTLVSVNGADKTTIKNASAANNATVYAATAYNVQIGSADHGFTILGNRDGISTNQVKGLTIEGNTLSNIGWHAVHIEGGNNALVNDNTINNVLAGNGVMINGTAKAVVSGNDIDKTTLNGVVATSVSNLTVSDNNIGLTGGANNIKSDGVLVKDSSIGAKVTGNKIANVVGNGLSIEGTSTLTALQGNEFSNNNQFIANKNKNFTLDLTANDTNKFDGKTLATTTDFYALEDKLTHAMDNSLFGKIITKTNQWFVTRTSGSIQRGVDIAAANDTVNVGDGTFAENVTIGKSLTLVSRNGRDKTKIVGDATKSGEGTLYVLDNVNNLTIGGVNKGFTVEGFDGAPAFERAAIYFAGDHDTINLIGNKFVAQGDSALTTVYGKVNKNFTIDNNIFDGVTYDVSQTIGTGDQFTDANVPRQLVAMNLGHQNVIFKNNEVIGNSGDRQLVAINSIGSMITGNQIKGTNTSYALHVRGSDATIQGNEIVGNSASAGIYAGNVTGTLKIGGSNLDSSADLALKANKVDGAKVGIVVAGGNNISVIGNAVKNATTAGIAVGNASGVFNQIYFNTVDSSNDGIAVTNTQSLIMDNRIGLTGNLSGNGIVVNDSANAQILSNQISNVAKTGIVVSGGTGTNAITGNLISQTGTGGINVSGTSATTIASNQLYRLTGDAINVSNSAGVQINKNTIGAKKISGVNVSQGTDNVKGDGIFVSGSNGAVIKGNYITETHSTGNNIGSGIQVLNTDGLTIGGTGSDRNTILNTGWEGIRLANIQNANIVNNSIDNVERVGIYAENATGSTIKNNLVSNATRYAGIYTQGGGNLQITGNTIDHSDETGILVKNSGLGYTFIQDNIINNTGESVKSSDGENSGDAIRSVNANGLLVTGNKVGLTGAINGNGVFFDPSDYAFIALNTINNVALNGIHSLDNSFASIQQNTITTTVLNGILVEGGTDNKIGGAASGFANNITGAGKDGIKLVGTDKAQVGYNKITTTGDNGISVATSNNANVHHNVIKQASKAGIKIAGSTTGPFTQGGTYTQNTLENIGNQGFLINGATDGLALDTNYLKNIGWSGIQMDSGKNATLVNNDLTTIGADGFRISGTQTLTVDGNAVVNARTVGINLNNTKNATITRNNVKTTTVSVSGANGIQLTNSVGTNLIDGNIVDRLAKDGVYTKAAANLIVSNNDIGLTDVVGGNGINVNNAVNATINNNEIKASTIGIFINDVLKTAILNNTVNGNNQYGLFLKSVGGSFVLTNNVINSLAGGVGARFEAGTIDLTGVPNTFNGGTNGLEFSGPDLKLVDDTFGTTVFNGQSNYYISLSDNALFGPGPDTTLLDARFVNFDGFIPGSYVISFFDYKALTAKLYDYRNDGSLGWIYFTFPGAADANEILPQQRRAVARNGGTGSVTILGLPYASLELASAARLANIVPAAGGNNASAAALNNIATAAGGSEASAEDLNALETAAGGDTARCWGQVYSHFGASSTAVTYDLNESPTSVLSDQVACNGQ